MSPFGYTKIDFLIANANSEIYHSWNCKTARKTIKNPLIIDPNNPEEIKLLNGFRSCGNCQPNPVKEEMDFFGDLRNNPISQKRNILYRESLVDSCIIEGED